MRGVIALSVWAPLCFAQAGGTRRSDNVQVVLPLGPRISKLDATATFEAGRLRVEAKQGGYRRVLDGRSIRSVAYAHGKSFRYAQRDVGGLTVSDRRPRHWFALFSGPEVLILQVAPESYTAFEDELKARFSVQVRRAPEVLKGDREVKVREVLGEPLQAYTIRNGTKYLVYSDLTIELKKDKVASMRVR